MCFDTGLKSIQSFFMVVTLLCHNGKNAGETNHINDGSCPLKCPIKPVSQDAYLFKRKLINILDAPGLFLIGNSKISAVEKGNYLK